MLLECAKLHILKSVLLVLLGCRPKSDPPEVFSRQPQAGLMVKAVKSFSEKSAVNFFYQRSSPDSSRPGTDFANLYNMKDMPLYQMEALAFHERVPAHRHRSASLPEVR